METEKLSTIKKNHIVEYDPIQAGLNEMRGKYNEVPDVTTKDGMVTVKENLKQYRGIKKRLEDARKTAKASIIEKGKAIDSEAKVILEEIEGIFKDHKQAKTDEDERQAKIKQEKEEAAAMRMAGIQTRMEGLKQIFIKSVGKSSTEIKAMMNGLYETIISEELYGDFEPEAKATKDALLGKMEALFESTKSQEETQEKLKKAEEELSAKQESQRLEDEKRAKEKEEADKIERERVEKENAALKEKMAVMEAKEKELEEKQAKIDNKEKLQKEKEEEVRLERERQDKIITDSIKAFDNFIIEARDCDTSEQCAAIVQAVRDVEPKKYGVYERDAEKKQSEVLAFVVAIHVDMVKVEREKAREQKRLDDEEKKRKEDAEALALKEAEQRRQKLYEGLAKHIDNPSEVEQLIEAIEDNEIPYLKIDWTKE